MLGLMRRIWYQFQSTSTAQKAENRLAEKRAEVGTGRALQLIIPPLSMLSRAAGT